MAALMEICYIFSRRKRLMGASRFEYYQGMDGKWYFRLRAANGEIVAVGEGYATKHNCLTGIEAVRRAVAEAGEPGQVEAPKKDRDL
jgi:hypothetical protein